MQNTTPYSLSLVIPVYNEADSLRQLHKEISHAISNAAPEYEIIFVDDGSEDDSFAVCQDLYNEDPDHVRVIALRRNFGQTAAMAAGFDAASGDLVVPLDADLQNDPADIPGMVELIVEGFDVVSGWRADRKEKFLSRRLPSLIANRLISGITGVHLHDYGCTLKVYRRSVLEQVQLYGEHHRFIPALASWAGARVTEVKVNHRKRVSGRSKYGMGRTLRVVLDLITVKFLLSYSTSPMQVFGLWGICSLAIGLLAGLAAVGLKLLPPHLDMTDSPWIYVSMLFMLGGLQLLVMGLLGELNIRTYYESQQKSIYVIREVLKRDRT